MEAIGLNQVRLDAIGIDPIRLNAIRLGVPGASSGSDRPYIAPEVLASLVAVVKCDGKSNNDPDRAIIKNLVDPANPFVISNAAYKLNSGFGKYEEDFTQSPPWYAYRGVDVTPYRISLNSNFRPSDAWIIYKTINNPLNDFKVRVSGIPNGGVLYFYITGISNKNIKLVNGDNDIKFDMPTTLGSSGFRIESPNLDWSKLVIEQIPSFQGALVTDGVDDLIVSQKSAQEMLGGSNEITVVSMMANLDSQEIMCNSNYSELNGYNIRNTLLNNGVTTILGYTDKSGTTNNLNLIMGDKNSIKLVDKVNFKSNFSFYPAQYINYYYKVAWYWTFIAKRALTTDEINQVIAYYNLDKYVKPDVYYDVKKQGLSNNTPDEDWYLKDYSGNSRDMQLYNYGKIPESGINEEGGLQSDGITDYGQFVGDLGLKDYTVAVDRAYPRLNVDSVPVVSNITRNNITPFLFEYANANNTKPYSFGTKTDLSPMELSRKISYQSTYIYDGTAINKGVHGNTGDGLTIGRFGIDTQYANIALWSLLLFPYSLSEFLLERQLKRYKLGTLYPDMVEVRPIINSTGKYFRIEYRNGQGGLIQPGSYLPVGSILRISVVMNDDTSEVSSLKVNGVDIPETDYSNGRFYIYDATVTKSPQKINIAIDEYIRYEDIVQPYPIIVKLKDNKTNKLYTYGDKIKVGTELKYAGFTNLLPELYKKIGDIKLNGKNFNSFNTVIIEKINVFTLTSPCKYLKTNEPNCIADPQRLRIPNSSYKILGYIPDISGHGNHLKINNSAYAGMSGANGYIEPFNDSKWHIGSSADKINRTDNKIAVVSLKTNKTIIYVSTGSYVNEIKVIATGIPIGGELIFNQDTGITIPNNVVVTIGGKTSTGSWGFIVNDLTLDWSNLVIQQIGKYEGSFCLDGVDDFITIPTLSHSVKQVLMKVNTQNMNGVLYDQRKSSGQPWHFAVYNTTEADSVAYNARNTNGKTYIDGVLNTNITCQQLLNITHNLTITNNGANVSNSRSPVIGSGYSTTANFSKMALYTLMIFDYISSEDEIKELNNIVGIEGGYVESPDYYWDAYGKSNTQADDIDNGIKNISDSKRSIFDKSITGLTAIEQTNADGKVGRVYYRALNSRNFVFNEESGYGGWLGIKSTRNNFNYAGNSTINNWSRGGTFVKGLNRRTGQGCGYALVNWFDNVNHILKFKVYIAGLTDADELYICQYNIDPEIKQQLFNGINEVILDTSTSSNPGYPYVSFRYPPLTNDVDFEFLYEYPNGLVSDGVDDHLINTIIPKFNDFTVITKRKFLNTELNLNEAFCMKGDNGYLGGVGNAFVMEYFYASDPTSKQTHILSFGGNNIVPREESDITWCTPTSYNSITINRGEGEDTVGLLIGKYNKVYWKGVFYKMMLYSKTIDMLSINMLKNLFARDELIDVNNPIFKQNN